MVDLTKPVKRVTRDLIREAGKVREVVVTLRPPNVLGFRAKGCRREYRLTAEVCYIMAVRAHVAEQKKAKDKARKEKKRANIRKGTHKKRGR